MVTFDVVRALALALPGVEETTSYGTPAFKVRGKLIARLREEGDVLVVKAEIGHREALIAARPSVYFVTPHYLESRYVLVRLAAVDRDELADLLGDAWHLVAPKRLAASLAGDREGGEARADP